MMKMAINGTPSDFDPKKRAFDALERRFALAKAEEQQLQSTSHKKRTFKDGEREERLRVDGMEVCSTSADIDISSSKKGNSIFRGGTPQRGPGASDEQLQDPAYAKLTNNLHGNLLNPCENLPHSAVGTVNKVIHNLLQNGKSAHKYMQGSRSLKIDNWFLLDNFVPSKQSFPARAEALRSHSKRSKRHMSMKQHRKCGSFDLPPENHKFNLFKPMHEMWKDYIMKLLKETGKQMPQRLLTADLHGAILLVVGCKHTAFVGINGIMIRETAETFGIITNNDKFRVVPKKGSVFIYRAGNWKITIYGDKRLFTDSGI